MYERSYGVHYDQVGTPKEAAAAMRATVKQWQREGLIPADIKVSIRYRSFAGGCSIDIRATSPRPIYWCDPHQWQRCDRHAHYGWYDCMTPEARHVREELEALHNAYNHDGSEIQVDYFDVRFYGQATIEYTGGEWGTVALAEPMPAPTGTPVHGVDWWPEYGDQ